MGTELVLIRFSKSRKRTVLDGFVKKIRGLGFGFPDGRRHPAASTASDSYLKLRSDACLEVWPTRQRGGGAAAARPFNLAHGRTGGHTQLRNVGWTSPPDKWILTREQRTQNLHLWPQKIRGFGLGRTWEESADSVADLESVTTLHRTIFLQ